MKNIIIRSVFSLSIIGCIILSFMVSWWFIIGIIYMSVFLVNYQEYEEGLDNRYDL